jgi:hypothetical protein
MKLNEALDFLKTRGYIITETSLKDKIGNAKRFNSLDYIVDVYNKIMDLDGTDDWEVLEEERDNYFTFDELTNGTLEKVARRNKGYTTIIISARKELNKYRDFVEIELCLTPDGIPVIRVNVNDGKQVKKFDLTKFKAALKYANIQGE